jgi:glycosyltransferase involved in cell wall biosynthesis
MKVCFMGLTGYQLLRGDKQQAVVGPDVYQVLLARELLKLGFQVVYINYDEGGPPVENIDGIEVIKIYPVDNSLNIIQKACIIAGAMKKADADIYFQQGGAGPLTPLFCRFTGKKCVISIGHDAYVDKSIRRGSGFAFNFKTALEIRLAHILIVLSESQKAMLKKNFGREGIVTGIHAPLPPRDMPQKTQPPVVLWVGTVYPRKQPELFLELARAIPQVSFRMVGGATDEGYVKAVKEKAKAIPNLELTGFIPYDQINDYFSRASVFVSTATSEGFPNVFIQAWMNYTPVVSLNIDPDDVIKRYKLGFHSETFERMVKDIQILLGDEKLRDQMGSNCRRYTEENNDIKQLVKKHIEVFKRLVRPYS